MDPGRRNSRQTRVSSITPLPGPPRSTKLVRTRPYPASRRPSSRAAADAGDRVLGRAEPHDPARLFLLDHAALLEQKVDVAEHLAQGQVGLGDRDVTPQRL